MEPRKILIVDDDDSMRHMPDPDPEAGGLRSPGVGRGSEALLLLRERNVRFHPLRCDHAGNGGLDLLRVLKEKKIEATIIMMSAYGSLDTALEAMKLGAYDYVSKPFNRTRFS